MHTSPGDMAGSASTKPTPTQGSNTDNRSINTIYESIHGSDHESKSRSTVIRSGKAAERKNKPSDRETAQGGLFLPEIQSESAMDVKKYFEEHKKYAC